MSSPMPENIPTQTPSLSPLKSKGKEKIPFVPPAHGLAQWAWMAEIGGALLVVLILTVTQTGGLFRDSCCLWHPVVGEKLLNEGWITTDPFSHTFEGRFWIPFQWLGEVTMAKLYALAGYDGIFWATLALFGSMFGWLVGRAVRFGCHPILAILIGSLTFFECCHHFHARPHLATMAGMCFLAALLTDVEAGRLRKLHLLWIVPLFCLWANVHGGVLGGWGTMGIVFFGWGIYWLAGWKSPIDSWKTVGWLLLLCVLATGVFLINPYGYDYMKMWALILKADLPKIIIEHAPLDPFSAVGITVLGEAALYFFILVGTFPKHQTRVMWLLPIVWLILGCSRIRHAPLFSLVAMIAIIDMLPYCRWTQWLAKRSDLYVAPKSDDPKEPIWGILVARLFPLLILSVPFITGLRIVELDKEWWPLELIPALKEQAKKPGVKLFNEDRLAGMVIRYVPELKVFVDDRCELYGEAFLLDYLDAIRDRPSPRLPNPDPEAPLILTPDEQDRQTHWFTQWGKTYGINLALTHPKSKFTAYLRSSPDWKLVQEVKGGCLFVKR